MTFDDYSAAELQHNMTHIAARANDALVEIEYAENQSESPKTTMQEALDAMIEINDRLANCIPAANAFVGPDEDIAKELNQYTPATRKNKQMQHEIGELIYDLKNKGMSSTEIRKRLESIKEREN